MLAGSGHRPIVDSESTIASWGQTNLSQLDLSRLSLAKPAKLNFFKTPASEFDAHVEELISANSKCISLKGQGHQIYSTFGEIYV